MMQYIRYNPSIMVINAENPTNSLLYSAKKENKPKKKEVNITLSNRLCPVGCGESIIPLVRLLFVCCERGMFHPLPYLRKQIHDSIDYLAGSTD